MTTPAEAREVLDALARELGERSSQLAKVSRELDDIVGPEYHKFVDDFDIGLLTRSEDEEGYKLPSAALRLKLAHKAMDPALLGRYMGLTKSRERLLKRISDLNHEANSQRTIVSALKAEMEATS